MATGRRLRRAAAAAASTIAPSNRRQRHRRRRYRPTCQYRRRLFSLRSWSEAKVRCLYRFSKAEIRRLLAALYLYGDPSYKHSYGIMAPFKHPRGHFALEPLQQKTNERLSSAMIAIEHAFRHTQVLWTYTAFGKGLRAGSFPVAACFAIAVLLTNCLTCLRGNQTSQRFVVTPPTLKEYLSIN
jgi:hypothetical protein